jgi:hypothetical protein
LSVRWAQSFRANIIRVNHVDAPLDVNFSAEWHDHRPCMAVHGRARPRMAVHGRERQCAAVRGSAWQRTAVNARQIGIAPGHLAWLGSRISKVSGIVRRTAQRAA